MDLRLFAALPERDLRREGILIGEGRLVARRVASRCALLGVLAEESAAEEAEELAGGRCPVAVLSRSELEAVAGFPFHRGLLVAAERPRPLSCSEESEAAFLKAARRLVVLPNPTDPENLGAVVRSAAALGWDAVALGSGSCDPFGRRALRCSMGATLVLPVYEIDPEDFLSERPLGGFAVVAAALEEASRPPEVLAAERRLALMFGNERYGVPSPWRAVCSYSVAIPQGRTDRDGVDSLNVAAAAAILLWEGRPGSGPGSGPDGGA